MHSFVFDFDSTLIRVESLDMILSAALGDDPGKIAAIEAITQAGMNGEIPLQESLKRRLSVAGVSQKILDQFAEKSCAYLTKGMEDLVKFLQEKGQAVFVLSGGFFESIYPVAKKLGISQDRCFGNKFLKEGEKIVGVDFTNPLTQTDGKTQLILQQKKAGQMPGRIHCIGDGISDADPYVQGVADYFWGFGGNVVREVVREKSTDFFTRVSDLKKALEAYV
jgi:HAD superfamily phosphoserine phosphatase-like hydrolase